MGDHLLQIGCADGGALAAVAAKVGLSGRAVAIVADDESAARAAKGAAQQGVLVEVETAPPTALPVDAGEFDLVIVDDTRAQFATLDTETQTATAREQRLHHLPELGALALARRRKADGGAQPHGCQCFVRMRELSRDPCHHRLRRLGARQ